MNRFDTIQGAARDIADVVCHDPAERNRMADGLIRLTSLIVAAVGKSVAVDGESNTFHGEDEAAHARYITGERIQDGAREVAEGAMGADLERYERSGLTSAWTSTRKQSTPAVTGDLASALTAVQSDPASAPSEATGPLAAIQRVRELHEDSYGYCEPCSAGDYPGYAVQHPCPTIQALNGSLSERDAGPSCEWPTATASPACDFAADCPVHGWSATV